MDGVFNSKRESECKYVTGHAKRVAKNFNDSVRFGVGSGYLFNSHEFSTVLGLVLQELDHSLYTVKYS